MAYISTDDVKAIRTALKKEFPELKLSVTRSDHSGVNVSIMKGNIPFEKDYEQINHYYLENYKQGDLFKRIAEIANTAGEKQNYNRSDIMTDYFDVGYYVYINVGKWDKPYIYTGE